MSKHSFFAVDIGASSGRTIIGTLDEGVLNIEEFTRFANPLIEVNGHFYWNLLSLYQSITEGLKKAADEGIKISSIGIDTWGVDFITIDKNRQVLGMPYSYRDPHTSGASDNFFKLIPRKEVYRSTGIQIMNFNSLYQFFTLSANGSTMLKEADKILFMPDGLSYLLTGETVMEYTIASTAQILNPYKKELDGELLQKAGVDKKQFGRFVLPGTVIGNLSASVCRQTGLDTVPVIAVAGHDTASAVASIPAVDKHFAYLSSGTWSLMGIEVEEPIINEKSYELNFTNEGGVDKTIRFLKNICGMWLLEQCRKEWDKDLTYSQLIEKASASQPFKCLVNPDAEIFANPPSMTRAISEYCFSTGQPQPQGIGEYVRCIFDSLALRYRQVFDHLQELAPFHINKLHVVGGGAKNDLLNQFTANALNIPVVAGPCEATAIGNIMLQAKALHVVDSLQDMRRIINNSVQPRTFQPQDAEVWNNAYSKYLTINKS